MVIYINIKKIIKVKNIVIIIYKIFLMKRIKAKYGQIVFCTVLIFSFLSCQKNNVTEQKSENKIDNNVIGHLIKWMNTQKKIVQ